MNLPTIPADKAQHLAYGLAAAVAGVWALALLLPHLEASFAWAQVWQPWMGAVLVALAAGLVKEAIDRRTGGPFSAADVAWTTLPGLLVALAMVAR